MKIGIVGSGTVGQALGTGFAKHGWDVMVGSREPGTEKLVQWKSAAGARARTGTFSEAARFGEVVVLATMGQAAEAALDLAGPPAFKGKLVLDATNPLDFSRGMPPGLLFGLTDSLGERVQRKLPDAHVVKCFNTVPNTQMVDPQFRHGPPPMMICGNDAGAKKRAADLLKEIGWTSTLDVGGIEASRWLEALVPLWLRVGTALGTFSHAFQPVT